MTEGLKEQIDLFERCGEVHFTSEQITEFKQYCQDVFRFSIDTSCGDCVCKYINKTIVHLKK